MYPDRGAQDLSFAPGDPPVFHSCFALPADMMGREGTEYRGEGSSPYRRHWGVRMADPGMRTRKISCK